MASVLSRRVKYVSIAIVVAVSVAMTTCFLLGATATAWGACGVVIVAAATWVLDRRGRIAEQQAAAVIWILWCVVVAATMNGVGEIPSWAIDQWLAMLFIGYAAIQLERRYIFLAFVPGAIAWSLLVAAGPAEDVLLRIITACATLALAGLAYVGQLAFVTETQRLRRRDLERERVLANALQIAQHELAERARAEKETAQMRERLELSHRMQALGTLAGGVAHELNNVLAGIMGIASLLQDQLEGTEREDIDVIMSSCERGAELTSALLVFGRRRPVKQEPTCLRAVLAEVEPILRRARPNGATLEIDAGSQDLGCHVNRAELAQALVNLVLNAFHACPSGAVRVVVEGPCETGDLPVESEGPLVQISVSDEGCGMDEPTRHRAFEPFFTTKAPGVGTGLGLSQVYGAVASSRGFAEIESKVGEGTIVRLWLPQCDVPEDETTPTPRPDVTGRVALVVDDEPLVRRASQLVLARAGYEVHPASDADEAEAVAKARGGRFDVVLLDLAMPGRDGAALAASLKAQWPDLFIVVYSGNVDAEAEARCRAAGVAKILTKPLPAEDLVAALRKP
ncbi:MAG: response regulator [Deltaproteobacteria bacterium]